jgi:soluble lytic murein transglycosylase-like protein
MPASVSTNTTQQVWRGKPLDNPFYDLSIRKWNSIYNPEIPWYWAKAQLAAESALKPNAVSPVGAKGLGQFMPDTWNDMERELGFNGSEFTPVLSIQAHAYYMKKLRVCLSILVV